MRRKPVILAIAAVSVGAIGGVAYAASMNLTESKLDAGSVAVLAQCSGTPTIDSVVTHYTAANGYRIDNVEVTSVGAGCQNLPYVVAEANNVAGYAKLGEWTGTMPGGPSGTLSPATITDAADVNSLNITNEQIQVFLVTKTS